jgi:hypothetical protein
MEPSLKRHFNLAQAAKATSCDEDHLLNLGAIGLIKLMVYSNEIAVYPVTQKGDYQRLLTKHIAPNNSFHIEEMFLVLNSDQIKEIEKDGKTVQVLFESAYAKTVTAEKLLSARLNATDRELCPGFIFYGAISDPFESDLAPEEFHIERKDLYISTEEMEKLIDTLPLTQKPSANAAMLGQSYTSPILPESNANSGHEKEDEVSARKQSTVAKIIIGMAVEGYGYRPSDSKSPVTKEIVDDLSKLGVSVGVDTVREWLVLGAAMLSKETLDMLARKPK